MNTVMFVGVKKTGGVVDGDPISNGGVGIDGGKISRITVTNDTIWSDGHAVSEIIGGINGITNHNTAFVSLTSFQ